MDLWQSIFGVRTAGFIEAVTAASNAHPFVQLIEMLCWSMLTYQVIIGVYLAVGALIETMRTGKPGGEMFSVWSLIRWVFGILALLPIFGGYAIAPGIVMMGAGLGDELAKKGAAIYTGVILAENTGEHLLAGQKSSDGRRVVAGLFNAAKCARAMNTSSTDNLVPINVVSVAQPPRYLRNDESAVVAEAAISYQASNVGLGPASCGKVSTSLRLPSSIQSDARARARVDARMAASFDALKAAQARIQTVVNGGGTDPNASNVQRELQIAANEYDARMASDRARAVASVARDIDSDRARLAQQAEDSSWMLLGAWYYNQGKSFDQGRGILTSDKISVKGGELGQFSIAQKRDLGGQLAPISSANVGTGQESGWFEWLSPMRSSDDEIEGSAFSAEAMALAQSLVTGMDPFVIVFDRLVVKPLVDMRDNINTMTEGFIAVGDGDPVRALQEVGFTILAAVEAAYAVKMIVSAAGASAESTGVFSGTIGPAVASIIKDIVTPFVGVLFIFLAYSVALAYYLPFLPTIYFTLGVIQWVFDIIEGMLAMAFWCVTNSLPDGVGPFSDMGRNALSAYIGVIARPIMLIGFLLTSHYVMGFATRLMMQAFNFASVGVFSTATVFSVVSMVVTLGIFVAVMVALTKTVFQSIVSGPEAAVSWFGARFAGRFDAAHSGEIEGRVNVQGAMQMLWSQASIPRRK